MQNGMYGRNDRLIKTKRLDAYRRRKKLPDPTRCRSCGSVYAKGRWSWDQAPEDAHQASCPACQRVADRYPAGLIEIEGPFFADHQEEILNLINNIESLEKGEHPLQRLMETRTEEARAVVTTTGIHIARRIGEALSRSYSGELSFEYGDAQKTIRVHWKR